MSYVIRTYQGEGRERVQTRSSQVVRQDGNLKEPKHRAVFEDVDLAAVSVGYIKPGRLSTGGPWDVGVGGQPVVWSPICLMMDQWLLCPLFYMMKVFVLVFDTFVGLLSLYGLLVVGWEVYLGDLVVSSICRILGTSIIIFTVAELTVPGACIVCFPYDRHFK